MAFLQPLLLAALPLIALPVIIHLINQRRHQTIRWGAMMFLLAANRMSSGYAKLRQFLILLFRMLAIACLIFVISRPLASGWLGLTAGGRPDLTIILLDRSPSMQQQDPATVSSKLQAGLRQLARTLKVIGSDRWLLVDSASNVPREIESPDAILTLPSTGPTDVSANVPAMLEAARDYIKTNKSGRTEIWLCSDIRKNDWDADNGQWRTLKDSFLEFPQTVRFNLLAYSEVASENVAVRVTDVRRHQTSAGTELLLSLTLRKEGASEGKQSIPVQFEIEGARSELTVEMQGGTFELKDHRIGIEGTKTRGWGKVSIPSDANPSDNDYYFVFDQPQTRQTLIVSEDERVGEILKIAASISPDPAIRCSAETVRPDQLGTVTWDNISLVLWAASLPAEDAASAVNAFVERGGQIVFLPPQTTTGAQFMNVGWQSWVEEESDIPIETWRGDQDLLANTQSGASLPVGQLQVRRYCTLQGELTGLASLQGGKPLLARLPTNRGGVYFCATTPDSKDSSLAVNGVVMYVFIQRALAAGAAVLGHTQQLAAGASSAEQATTWKQLAGPPEAISTDYHLQSGVYSAGEKLLAMNRASPEDLSPVLTEERVADLFQGLDFTRVNDRSSGFAELVQEIWRLFLVSMLIAMLVEAGLCLPNKARPIKTSQIDAREFMPEATSPGGESNGEADGARKKKKELAQSQV